MKIPGRARKGRYEGPVGYDGDKLTHYAVKQDKQGRDTIDRSRPLTIVVENDGFYYEHAQRGDQPWNNRHHQQYVELQIGDGAL